MQQEIIKDGINMKYVFLDIDGVISTYEESMNTITQDYWIEHPWTKRLKLTHGFNVDCVKIFNEILLKTGAKIILSSDWKRNSLSDLNEIFKKKTFINKTFKIK